jgi:hypothetical protein
MAVSFVLNVIFFTQKEQKDTSATKIYVDGVPLGNVKSIGTAGKRIEHDAVGV